jgi:hypothetical protein
MVENLCKFREVLARFLVERPTARATFSGMDLAPRIDLQNDGRVHAVIAKEDGMNYRGG